MRLESPNFSKKEEKHTPLKAVFEKLLEGTWMGERSLLDKFYDYGNLVRPEDQDAIKKLNEIAHSDYLDYEKEIDEMERQGKEEKILHSDLYDESIFYGIGLEVQIGRFIKKPTMAPLKAISGAGANLLFEAHFTPEDHSEAHYLRRVAILSGLILTREEL